MSENDYITYFSDKYNYISDFYAELVSFLDHGFMIIQPRFR